jgi:hypothetical protein
LQSAAGLGRHSELIGFALPLEVAGGIVSV